MADLLKVEKLRVSFSGDPNSENAVLAGVDLAMNPGEALALVGPSGCGKSLLARAVLGLLPPGAGWSGSISWKGTPLISPEGPKWSAVRGAGMTLVLQEPMTSLNPVLSVGEQISETIRVRQGLSRSQAHRKAVALLEEMLISDAAKKERQYPHQLSGGMRQRVLLAAAMACDPDLLIADEPTTALDVTVQREILALIDRLRRERGMALLFITHDEDLVTLVSDRVARMRDGRIVGDDEVTDGSPAEGARAQAGIAGGFPSNEKPVMSARAILAGYGEKARRHGSGQVNVAGVSDLAVSGVDLDLYRGRAVGLAGESGCGKTTLGRVLARHLAPLSGTLELEGRDFLSLQGMEFQQARHRVQMLFQDPAGSLNPRQTVFSALMEAAGGADKALPVDLLAEVGLPEEIAHRLPHELSGGQRQRVALARCLATDPRVLVADEPTSALDPVSRKLVLSLLADAMAKRGLALVVISHDLSVLHDICQQVTVMYAGLVMESYPAELRDQACHPYTLELVRSTPDFMTRNARLWSEASGSAVMRSPASGAGCPWVGRCSIQKSHCSKELPPLKEVGPGHWLRCPEAGKANASLFIDT